MKTIVTLVFCAVLALAAFTVVRWGGTPSPSYQQYANCMTANPGGYCPPPNQN